MKRLLLVLLFLNASCVLAMSKSKMSAQQADLTARRNLAFWKACKDGQIGAVKRLLDKGGDTEASINGFTPLGIACVGGHLKVVKLLLAARPVNEVLEGDKPTPLHIACELGHEGLVKTLLDSEANIEAINESGVTPLYYCSQNGHSSIVQLLLAKNANVDACAKNGITPLIVACNNGKEDIVEILIAHKADINTRTEEGATPLYYASLGGHTRIVKALLDANADISSTSYEMTPLHAACLEGHLKVVRLLCKKGANINSVVQFTQGHDLKPADLAEKNNFKQIKKYLERRHCAVCKDTNNLLVCAGCKKIYYCGTDHQVKDWKNHKKVCGSK